MAISVSVKTSEQEILGGSVEPLEPPGYEPIVNLHLNVVFPGENS